MSKTAVLFTTIILSMTACNGNQYLQKNSLHPQEETISTEQKIAAREIPVDLLKMIENERQQSRSLNNLTPVTNHVVEETSIVNNMPSHGAQISEIEPVNITTELIDSGAGKIRTQSPINGIYKDIYEYDLPPKQNTYSHGLFNWDNIFEYGIPISDTKNN